MHLTIFHMPTGLDAGWSGAGCKPWGVTDDPVVIRRQRILKLTSAGQKFGFACFGAALLLFFIGLFTGFPSWTLNPIVVLLVVGSVVLCPAIIFTYAAKAAQSEDDGKPFTY
jgi:hypothetical protein